MPPRPALPVPALAALLLASAPACVLAQVKLAEAGDWSIESRATLQYDGFRYADPALGGGDRTQHGWRRAELVFRGNAPGGLRWVAGRDVHSDRWLDVNLSRGFGEGGRHRVTLGQSKHNGGLDEMGSASETDFVAKAATTSTFVIGRRLGLGYVHDAGDWVVQASVFDRELNDGYREGLGQSARVAWAPVKQDGHTLHIGGFMQRMDIPENTLRLRSRPQAELTALRRIDTLVMDDARRQTLLGAEAMWLRGPLKLQGEWMRLQVARAGAHGDAAFDGGYASALWNLAGETWGWRGGQARLPEPAGSIGLWQAGLRLDSIELNDGAVRGGRMQALTTGVNWLPSDWMKLQLNHVTARSRRAGERWDDRIIEGRAQLYW